MAVNRIDRGLPTSDKIEDLNDQTIELDGRNTQAKFNKHQLKFNVNGTVSPETRKPGNQDSANLCPSPG